jgi:hypothetical protein
MYIVQNLSLAPLHSRSYVLFIQLWGKNWAGGNPVVCSKFPWGIYFTRWSLIRLTNAYLKLDRSTSISQGQCVFRCHDTLLPLDWRNSLLPAPLPRLSLKNWLRCISLPVDQTVRQFNPHSKQQNKLKLPVSASVFRLVTVQHVSPTKMYACLVRFFLRLFNDILPTVYVIWGRSAIKRELLRKGVKGNGHGLF